MKVGLNLSTLIFYYIESNKGVEIGKLAPRRQLHQLATTSDLVFSYDNLARRWLMAGDMKKFQYMDGKQEQGVWNI
ncbi:hypothetical protein HanHA89_Chr17g0708621 [Helianthus annuus]|nr:hypothetical protein HanHA89_Chr17g0708621 [Helianthus annuus]